MPAYTFGEASIWLVHKAPEGTLRECYFLYSQMLFGLGTILLKHFFPRPVTVKTVVGPPIKFPKVADPSPEEVNRMLAVYKEALTKLYNEHTPHKDRSLRFVENLPQSRSSYLTHTVTTSYPVTCAFRWTA